MGKYLDADCKVWHDEQVGISVNREDHTVTYCRRSGIVTYTDEIGKKIELPLYVLFNLAKAARTLDDVMVDEEGGLSNFEEGEASVCG